MNEYALTIVGLMSKLGILKFIYDRYNLRKKRRNDLYSAIVNAKRLTMFYLYDRKNGLPADRQKELKISESWDEAAIEAREISENARRICTELSESFQRGEKPGQQTQASIESVFVDFDNIRIFWNFETMEMSLINNEHVYGGLLEDGEIREYSVLGMEADIAIASGMHVPDFSQLDSIKLEHGAAYVAGVIEAAKDSNYKDAYQSLYDDMITQVDTSSFSMDQLRGSIRQSIHSFSMR